MEQCHPLSSKLLHRFELLSSARAFSNSTCGNLIELPIGTILFIVFHLYILLVVDLFIQPALQQASFPHYQHLWLHVPGGVDVFLRRVRRGLVPGTLLVLILLLRSSIWWRLLLVVLMPLLLLPLQGYSQNCIFQNCRYLASALNIEKAPATVDTAADTAGTAASTRQTRKLADQALQGCPTSLDHHSCCRILRLLQSAK